MPELETIARALAKAAGVDPDAVAASGIPAMFMGGYLMPAASDQVPAWKLFTASAQAVIDAMPAVSSAATPTN